MTNVALFVGSATAPTTGDATIKTLLESLGYTVTYCNAADAIPAGTWAGFILAQTGSSADYGTRFTARSEGVVTLNTGGMITRLNLGSTNSGTRTGTTTQVALVGADSINSGLPNPLTIFSTAQGRRGVPATLAAGVTSLGTIDNDSTRSTAGVAAAGSTATTGTFAGARGYIILEDACAAALSADGQTWAGRIFTRVLGDPGTSTPSGGSTTTVTATASGAGTKHASGGSTATVTATASGGGHNGSFVPLRILEVVGDPTNLAADSSGQALYNHWTAAGHTVTLIDDAATAPATLSTDYDLVWVTNSVPAATNLATLGYDAAAIPVIATGVRSPHTGYASTGATTPGTTQDTIYLKASGVGAPMTPTDLTAEQTLTVLTTAYNQRYTLNTALGAGARQVAADAAGTLTHITWSYYELGDSMSTGTAPSKRAWFLFHPGSTPTTRGWQFMDGLLDWAATKHASGGSTASVAATASGAGVKHASGGSTATASAAASGAGEKVTSGGAQATITATATGAGTKAAAGGATTTVTATASGQGISYRYGGATTGVTVTSTGGGHGVVPGSGGSTTTVTATASGSGWTTRYGGSTATLTAAATGAGVKRTAGAAGAQVTVTATGSGHNGAVEDGAAVRDPRLTLTATAGTLTLTTPASTLTITTPASTLELT